MADIPNATQDVSLLTQDGTELQYFSDGSNRVQEAVISGVNYLGAKTRLLTDASGRLQTIVPIAAASTNIAVQIAEERLFAAVNNGEWQEILSYTVPTGYDLSCTLFDCYSSIANEKARAIYKKILGTYNCSTNTFTDGTTWTLPQFASRMYVYVTTAIGSGANDTVTITYTNQTGTTGRTASVTITKSSLVGTRLEATLQAGDYGIIDVTNVAHSATGQAGAFEIGTNVNLFFQVESSANVGYTSPAVPLGAVVVPQGGTLYLQYQTHTLTNSLRRISLTGTLVPR